jgi:hypothetical protein
VTRYDIHLMTGSIITIDAAKINTGERWLWMFDAASNLIGMFTWKNIIGFAVQGTANDQVITDRLPFEMGKIPPEEYGDRLRAYVEERQRRESGK